MDKADGGAAATIIIKRVEGGEAAGHHGGAWKVAYADFVTAMMAFFLLMWLLNATTEDQRRGLADYFNPTIIHVPGAAGDGIDPGVRLGIEEFITDTAKPGAFEETARQVQDRLNGLGAESMEMQNLLRHVVTRMTDEGLVIELGDLTDQPLFVDKTAQPAPLTRDLVGIVAGVLGRLNNEIAISGHVHAFPEMLASSPVWALSDARAHTIRNLLEEAGLEALRVQRVSGYADRRNRTQNPMDVENNRIEVILLNIAARKSRRLSEC